MTSPPVFPIGPRPGRQRGLTLLEAAVGLAALGLVSAAVVATLQQSQNRQQVDADRGYVQQARHAVLGAARVDAHFPRPDDAVPSPGRPGYLEGWLPAGALGLPPSRRVRYLVDASLVDLPMPAALYKADPYQLAGGQVLTRTTPGPLDICHALMRRERAGASLPGGLRAAFALQEVLGANTPAGGAAQLWLDDTASAARPAQVQFSTTVFGFGESVQAMGCLEDFARLAARVKSAAVAADLKKMSALNLDFRELAVAGAQEGTENLRRKQAIWTLKTVRMAAGHALATIAMRSTAGSPAGYAAAFATQAASITALAGASVFLQQIQSGVDKAPLSEAAAKAARDAASAYDQSVGQLWQAEAARANLQQGIAP